MSPCSSWRSSEHLGARSPGTPGAGRRAAVYTAAVSAAAVSSAAVTVSAPSATLTLAGARRGPALASFAAGSALALPAACGPQALPDPRLTARRWVAAVQARDEAAMYELLTDSARREHGREGVARLLATDREELLGLGRAATASTAVLETHADVSFGGDRTARVVLEEGRFRVAAAAALPAGAASPRDALRELRDVLAQRSFAGLLRVLTRESAQSLDGGLEDVVEALAEPSTVAIEVEGRRATARLPGGHTVTLEREDGIWRVKEVD